MHSSEYCCIDASDMHHKLQMHCKSMQLLAHVIVNETIRGTMIEAELCDEKGEHDEMGATGKGETS